MNPFNRILFAGLLLALMASCESDMSMLTEVHADGSLDKTIVLEGDNLNRNLLGINDTASGWEGVKKVQETTPEVEGDTASQEKKSKIALKKHFSSAAAANAELGVPNDTLFRVTSTFEKKFRWFYTYLYYADTYHALNKFDYPIDDYLTQEDYEFIDRLPAEGAPMSRADSLYLKVLEHKIFDVYGARACFNAYYSTAEELLKKNHVDAAWLDTLHRHKEDLLARLLDDDKDAGAIDDDFMLDIMDSLGIPLPADAPGQYKILIHPTTRKAYFLSSAYSTSYSHTIAMPWDVVRTNADSTSGRLVFWNPPVIKFLVEDYTMYAEARRMNYWAVALSFVVIAFTVYLLLRRRS